MIRMTQRTIALAVISLLALASFVTAAPKGGSRYFTVSGRVLKVDNKARTMLVDDRAAKTLYLVIVPEGETFKITFGQYMDLASADIWQAHKNDRVRLRCTRTDNEHLAELEDGRQAVVLTAAH